MSTLYTFTNISRSRLSLVQYGVGILEVGQTVDIYEKDIRSGLLTLVDSDILSVTPVISDSARVNARLDVPKIIRDFSKLAPRIDNPVLSDPLANPKLMGPCVIYDKNKFGNASYKKFMMFVQQEGGSGADQALSYSFSEDGFTWDTPIKLGSPLPVGVNYPSSPCVVYDPSRTMGSYFKMWYIPSGVIDIKITTSDDGIHWTTPVSGTETVGGIKIVGSTNVAATSVIGIRAMFFNKNGTSLTPAQVAATPRLALDAKYIGFFTIVNASGTFTVVGFSNDGLAWSLIMDDVMLMSPVDPHHSFDTNAHFDSVIKVDNYFVGFIVGGTGADNLQFGYAISRDLVNWEYNGRLNAFGQTKRWNNSTAAMEAFPTNQSAIAGNLTGLYTLNVIYDPNSFGRNIYVDSNVDKGSWSSMMAMCFWVEGDIDFSVSQGEIQ